MNKGSDDTKFLLGTALLTGGLIAASPADEIACLSTGPFAPVCVALAAVISTPLGLLAAAVGTYMIYSSDRG